MAIWIVSLCAPTLLRWRGDQNGPSEPLQPILAAYRRRVAPRHPWSAHIDRVDLPADPSHSGVPNDRRAGEHELPLGARKGAGAGVDVTWCHGPDNVLSLPSTRTGARFVEEADRLIRTLATITKDTGDLRVSDLRRRLRDLKRVDNDCLQLLRAL
jgi:hypothetical protein